MKSERREYPRRLLTGKNIFVIDQSSEKVATLMDLGTGGMRLKYYPEKATITQWSSTDIFTGEPNRVLVRDLGGKMVYDIAHLMENGSFSGSDVRICGVRFEGLTDAQKDDLAKLYNIPPLPGDDRQPMTTF